MYCSGVPSCGRAQASLGRERAASFVSSPPPLCVCRASTAYATCKRPTLSAAKQVRNKRRGDVRSLEDAQREQRYLDAKEQTKQRP